MAEHAAKIAGVTPDRMVAFKEAFRLEVASIQHGTSMMAQLHSMPVAEAKVRLERLARALSEVDAALVDLGGAVFPTIATLDRPLPPATQRFWGDQVELFRSQLSAWRRDAEALARRAIGKPGPRPDFATSKAAASSFQLLQRFGRRPATGTRGGPYHKLAGVLYEVATGHEEVTTGKRKGDLWTACLNGLEGSREAAKGWARYEVSADDGRGSRDQPSE
ncbi:hypothetical protein [Phenylobacterium sp.]|uniref:hypothetical protein n=1 Tax=Phenylobacterium sp. TaxID=1871053 RepID=UPI003565D976